MKRRTFFQALAALVAAPAAFAPKDEPAAEAETPAPEPGGGVFYSPDRHLFYCSAEGGYMSTPAYSYDHKLLGYVIHSADKMEPVRVRITGCGSKVTWERIT